jgi:hypothetical protein
VLLGVVCALVGVVLTLRPFTSLEALVLFVAGAFLATGVSELVGARNAGNRSLAALAGFGWIAAAVAVVVWAGHTIHALAIVTGSAWCWAVWRGLPAHCVGAWRTA